MWVQESAGVTHCVCVHLLAEALEAVLLRVCEETTAISKSMLGTDVRSNYKSCSHVKRNN